MVRRNHPEVKKRHVTDSVVRPSDEQRRRAQLRVVGWWVYRVVCTLPGVPSRVHILAHRQHGQTGLHGLHVLTVYGKRVLGSKGPRPDGWGPIVTVSF